MIEKDIKIYLHAIDNNLVCPKKQKKTILEDIEASIRDYIENENITDISQLYSHFGSAEEIAKTYLADFVTPADIKRAVNKKKALIIGVIVALIIWLLGVCIAVYDAHDDGPDITVYGPAIEAPEGVDVHDENYEVTI
ncbi:MAG: hypothetical protein E7538_07765 [Ruminococcaceae bacterium]|nr:hypothetical protein [Oscillospiraceae bacterium]